ncbi:MAG TPA: TIGR02302 family protein, partial [Roseiarcus sp.]|nr:TIGR02302 family protein [Roseiarcus sp.]
LRWPALRDVMARLDRDFGGAHRPATSLADDLANADDPISRALWAEHKARLARSVQAARVAPPQPHMAKRDPFALRFAIAMMAFAAAVTAGPELYGRIAAAFDWRGENAGVAGQTSRIDAWIDPPPYAGRPPVVVDVASGVSQAMTVFEDSVLVVRGEPGVVETKVEGAIELIENRSKSAESRPVERRWTLHGDGRATIRLNGTKAAEVAFSVIPSGTPTIELTKEPEPNLSGSLTLAYKIDDRYGVSAARAEFALPHDPSKPARRSLAQPPEASLETPASQNGTGEAKATLDLSEHPWAGAKVTMRLSATSVSGKTGRSAPVEVALPQRPFHNPLARALVEERRDLIIDPDAAPPRVLAALTGFMVAPETFNTPANEYLGLKQARNALEGARTDADLLDVAQLLWTIALEIEDGNLTQAQRDLRAAEKALRDALKRGASDDEIRKLMRNLREAAQRFAAEMARKAERNGDQTPRDSNRQAQSLDKMLDQLDQAARNGSRDEAEAMLDQMENMFENMQSAENAEESPAERALRKQIDELSKLLHDQQALRDDTFRSDQRDQERKQVRKRATPNGEGAEQPEEGGQPEQGGGEKDSQSDADNPDQNGKNLSDRQKDLSDRLAELQRRLKSLGMKGEKGFKDAEGDMKEAEGDLRGEQGRQSEGKPGQSGKGAAVDAQGRAIQALRQGAQGLQQQMSAQNGKGQGYQARRTRPGEGKGDDPLGSDREGNAGQDQGPLRDMGSVAERARKVMEELRRRLADPNRAPDERDYLERLMKRD